MRIISSYKFKICLSISLYTLLVLICIAKLTTTTLTKTTKQVFADRAEFIVKSATEIIDGDRYEAFLKTLDETDEWYLDVCSQLNTLQNSTGCKYLYAMSQKSGYDFLMILDGEDRGSDDFSKPGTIENIESYGYGPLESMNEKRMIVSDIDVSDEWGWSQSVYAPIVNSRGKSVGLIGCDFEAAALSEMLFDAKMKIYGFSMGGIILLGIITFIMLASFFKRLKKVTDAIEQMSAGEKDLTAQIPVNNNNEITVMAKACNNLMESLRLFIVRVKESSNVITSNTAKIVDDSVQVAELTAGATENFNSISSKAQIQNEITNNAFTEMESVNHDVEQLSEQIKKQNEAVDTSSLAIKTITDKISDVDLTIQKIADEYEVIENESAEGRKKQENVSVLLSQIEDMSGKLIEANTVISGIAEQTNLLAMNAAIEAAHAGENGKGFAVVADEIRKLAENSAEQTHYIESLISATQESISQIVKSSADSTNAFNLLGERIKNTGYMVQDIKTRIEEQNVQAENITSLMKILTEVEKEINSSSIEMSQTIQRAKEIVVESKRVSDEILESSRETSSQMNTVQDFSAESAENSRNNQKLIDSLSVALNQYKTDR